MNLRELGRTGIQVGEIGIGCEGFLEKPRAVVKEFLDRMERPGDGLRQGAEGNSPGLWPVIPLPLPEFRLRQGRKAVPLVPTPLQKGGL